MEKEDIESILIDLGYELDDRGDYWQTNAVYRGGDNRTALQIYKDTGVWKDYVQETGFLPLKALVEKSCEDLPKNEVEKILSNIGSELPSQEKQASKKISTTVDEIYNEEELEKLLPHYDFYNQRGISSDLLKKLKGGLSTQGQMYQRFVFPVYNEYQHIVGFAGRDMANKEGRPKWKHIGKKTKWIYPLYHPSFFEEKWQNKDIILVESIGDFLSISENSKEKCLVTFGLDVSPSLMNSLISINPKTICLSLNNDSTSKENRGLNASIKNYLKLLSYFDPSKIKICLPVKNDFGDMDKNDYECWFKKKNNIYNKNQKQDVKKMAEALKQEGKLSKNLSQKIKLLNE